MSQVVKLLPDGTGRVCIHWFIHDPQGPITNPSGEVKTNYGPIKIVGATGRIACQPKRDTAGPDLVGGDAYILMHSDEPRAATCPECLGSEEHKKVMEQLAGTLDTSAIATGAALAV